MATVLSILFLLILYQLIINGNAAVTMVNYTCSTETDDHSVQDKVKDLFKSFSTQASEKYFYSSIVGDNYSKIYGFFLCREDLEHKDCIDCITDATLILAGSCASSNEAVVCYYECILLYSNRSVFPLDNTAQSPFLISHSFYNVKDPSLFGQLLTRTIKALIYKATRPKKKNSKSSRNFAYLEAEGSLYSLAQCIPNMSRSECYKCLNIASDKMFDCCSASQHAMIFLPSCQMRYDMYRFYNVRKGNSLGFWKIVAIAVSLTVGAGVVVTSGTCFRAYQRRVDVGDINKVESLKMNMSDIRAATNNFSADKKLGRGGFGEVYKGKLGTGEDVAVKRLSRNSNQGIEEFKNEVLLVAKLQHRNLVRLLGFCLAAKEKILVYEFLPNLSLDHFLYDPEKRASLNWETRFKIINGIGRGLQYLHEDSRLKIIHRDLKASNILLDEGMNPKISDFGIAKLVEMDQDEGDTSRIIGTYGYMAPEYAMAGQFSEKSDVYSFGVMVLEIISGQRNSVYQKHHQHREELLQRAWRLWSEGRSEDIVDPLLGDDFSIEEVKTAHHIGLLCVHEDALMRPRMIPIVTALNGNSISLPLPTQPLFYTVGFVDDETRTNYFSLEVEGIISVASTSSASVNI